MWRFWVFFAAVTLAAQEWALIANPALGLKEMDARQIREIYLGKRYVSGEVRLIPLQLGAESPLRKQFEKEVLNMSREALRKWWIRRHYLGQRPPKVVGSAEAVVAFVRQVEGAIGYVPYALIEDENVTVLYFGGEGTR